MNKILRTITIFTNNVKSVNYDKFDLLSKLFEENGFQIQTKRIVFPKTVDVNEIAKSVPREYMVSVGSLNWEQDQLIIKECIKSSRVSFNLDLTKESITTDHAKILFDVIRNNPSYTFNFTYTFNNPKGVPYFPSANFEKVGFAVGLQPTNLSVGTSSLWEWFDNMKTVWNEIVELLNYDDDFLGIDSSIAPLFEKDSSLIYFIKRVYSDFSQTVTTDIYTQITQFIKTQNPKPFGLCGLMFPCLEDFDLASEYEKGEFDVERNIFLSLHSGLGIDTYPIGIDEDPSRVVEILQLIQALSNKYSKPLSVRFVSDGKSKIGDMTDYKNRYLKDVIVRKL